MATKHTNDDLNNDQALIVDIDLAIFGRPPAEFSDYEQGIFNEYKFVPSEQYYSARIKILKGFLEHENIYRTDFFIEKYKEQAIQNLEWSIHMLNGILKA